MTERYCPFDETICNSPKCATGCQANESTKLLSNLDNNRLFAHPSAARAVIEGILDLAPKEKHAEIINGSSHKEDLSAFSSFINNLK